MSDTMWKRKLIIGASRAESERASAAGDGVPEVLERDPEAAEEHVDRLGDDRDDDHREERRADEQHACRGGGPAPRRAGSRPSRRRASGPRRSRVRKVDAMPLRPLSRNSTIVAWVPTATMSCAPASYASSIATSSLVPSATNSWYVDAPLERGSRARARARRDARGARARRRSASAVLGHRVEVADDDVGLEADLEQRVGAAVDTDEHRPVLADVRPQRGEVAAVVVTAHDHERVAALELGVQRRQRRAART